MDKIIGLLGGIFDSGLGKLLLTVVATVGGIILYRYMKQFQIDQAGKDSGNDNIKDKQDIIGENKKNNDEAKTDSEAIDDFLKKEKP